MNNLVKISIDDDNNTAAPLWMQYPQQCNAQPAHLELYPDQSYEIELSAKYGGNIGGGTTCDVHNGKAYRFSLPSSVSRQALIELESDDIFVTLINQLVNIHNDDEHSGEEVRVVDDEIERHLESIDCANVWDTEEWLSGSDWQNEILKAGSIENAAKEYENAIEAGDVVLDIQDTLLEMANDYLFGLDEDDVTAKHRDLDGIVDYEWS